MSAHDADYLSTSLFFLFVDYSVHNGVFGGHIQVFYTLTAILFIICIVIAITTFKEVPLQISEHMQIDFDIASVSVSLYL